nr:hypothetical protein [Gammaproteobacteria bacterium]
PGRIRGTNRGTSQRTDPENPVITGHAARPSVDAASTNRMSQGVPEDSIFVAKIDIRSTFSRP